MSSASSGSLLTESMKYSKPRRPLRCAMLSNEPVDRLSSTSTSCPRAMSASERCDPMKPAPPVIRAFTSASVLESVDVLGDGREIRVAQSSVQWQRQHFVARLDGPRTFCGSGERERGLPGHGYRVMHEGVDAVSFEMMLQCVASFRPAAACDLDHEQMIDVPGIESRRHDDRRARQRPTIRGGERAAFCDPS